MLSFRNLAFLSGCYYILLDIKKEKARILKAKKARILKESISFAL